MHNLKCSINLDVILKQHFNVFTIHSNLSCRIKNYNLKNIKLFTKVQYQHTEILV